MKRNIIAIGGGRTQKTLAIDQEIIKLSNKKNPNFLFVPTARGDDQEYIDIMQKHFTQLGCSVDILRLVKEKPTIAIIRDKIAHSDIIYVGGGNTLRMMKLWRRLGVDKLFDHARQKGTVLCGVSAGSICWFNDGNSDSRKSINPEADYIKVTGLGFIDALHCPHFNSESDRKDSLKRMMRKSSGVAIAIDDCAALEVVDNTYRIITSTKEAHAYKIYWRNGICHEEVIEQSHQFKNIQSLLEK